MGRQDPRLVRVGEVQLACAFCRYQLFYDRQIMLSTPGLTMFDLDWMNKSAIGLICAQCGHIMQFMDDNITMADAPPQDAPPH